jgi:hypothetical protein
MTGSLRAFHERVAIASELKRQHNALACCQLTRARDRGVQATAHARALASAIGHTRRHEGSVAALTLCVKPFDGSPQIQVI